jgi:hypothetical protein
MNKLQQHCSRTWIQNLLKSGSIGFVLAPLTTFHASLAVAKSNLRGMMGKCRCLIVDVCFKIGSRFAAAFL